MEQYLIEYEKWLASDKVPQDVKAEIAAYSDEEKKIRFSSYLTFGTAGLRGKMGPGCAMMNTFTVAHTTTGLAELIKGFGSDACRRGVVIAYDSRNNSREFAQRCAEVLSSYRIKAYIFDSLRPTPELSFAIRELGCIAGINITASHNPKEYNGYKAYFEDGAQLSPADADKVQSSMKSLDIFDDVPSPDAADPEYITTVGEALDEKYIEKVLAERVNPGAIPDVADDLEIVYTPLHGAGAVLVPEVLCRAGLKKLYPVESQMAPDGNFPTVKFPNPEFPEAFAEGIKVAEREASDLIIATDPDSDRVGAMARCADGSFKCITGNQMGALLLDYIITAYEESGTMPPLPYAVKSIVTSEMASKICASHGVKMYDVLTGFKYIGEVIKHHEELGKGSFILGFEESYGYLKGTYARDKDAVVASMLICEMAAYYKRRGMNLIAALEGLFERYGYFVESVTNVIMDTPDGKERMASTMQSLRDEPVTVIGERRVVTFSDLLSGKVCDTASGKCEKSTLPPSDVLIYVMDDGGKLIIRPSGTEPKIKIYVLTNGESRDAAKSAADDALAAFKKILGE
ncbi:MAG: phospho-sugar mutase [Clostridia bacterium]|nr:phospho-sugar mutase [Clostridia bacterium]